ncbi:hypothetical protein [Streptomyces umbrinus]|uniref:hypothetical protein n=1 Tax=Streptomyces umbrinus TaxID=67370 RepID=UPI003404D1E7
MTDSLAHSPRLLLIATAVLIVTGAVLLTVPNAPNTPADPAPQAAVPTLAPWATAPDGMTRQTGGPASTTEPTASALPPRGEGAPADAAIQRSLEAAWPADLTADDERKLLAAGRGLLRADATGVGRARWPALFGGPNQEIAPAFATARFRIQAAVARRDGRRNRAVVHLVWAGTDRGGTYTDRRLTDWYFTRTSTKGASTWTPLPRT